MSKAEERLSRLKAEAERVLERGRKKAQEAMALQRRINAQKAAEERKYETRRKILIGSMHLERAANYPDHKERVLRDLEKYLTRDDDRRLFGLEPRPKTAGPGEEPNQAS